VDRNKREYHHQTLAIIIVTASKGCKDTEPSITYKSILGQDNIHQMQLNSLPISNALLPKSQVCRYNRFKQASIHGKALSSQPQPDFSSLNCIIQQWKPYAGIGNTD
jgi:hypothetical protein